MSSSAPLHRNLQQEDMLFVPPGAVVQHMHLIPHVQLPGWQTKTYQLSFGEGFRDPSEQKILEKHVVLLENMIDHSSQKQCGGLGLGFCFVLLKKKKQPTLSANVEELVML